MVLYLFSSGSDQVSMIDYLISKQARERFLRRVGNEKEVGCCATNGMASGFNF